MKSRPLLIMAEDFPRWNPVRMRVSWQGNFMDIKYLRNSSSAFIHKKDVREIIFSDFDNTCACCGSKEVLEIDHVKSIFWFFRNRTKRDILLELNSRDNLQLLCKNCNIDRKSVV